MNLLAIAAAVVFVLDQLTKWLVLRYQPHEVAVLGKFFQLTYVTNRGAAWGVFSRAESSNALLAAFSILTILLLFAYRRALAMQHRRQRLAIGLIAGGIFGNLADRIQHGSVVDFLDFHLGSWIGHWPAFNIADSAICVGVFVYLLLTLWGHAAEAHAVIKADAAANKAASDGK